MDPILGQIQLFGFDFAPTNWHFCDGSLLHIKQNEALFALLKTTYGGNGTTTFGLPELKEKHKDGDNPLMYCICVNGIYPSRD